MIRSYQRAALAAVGQYYTDGCRRQLIVMPTGTGKTVVFSQLPGILNKLGLTGQILVLAHRKELIQQAADKLQHWNPGASIGVEQAENISDPDADIVVASVPTIGRRDSKRLLKFVPERFAAVVCDEAHHSTAETYQRVFEHFGFPKLPPRDSDAYFDATQNEQGSTLLLGVTATPQRGDEEPLGQVYQNEIFNYSLRQAIEEGWLVDLRAFRIRTGSDISRVKTVAGDFNAGQLETAINTPERNQEIVRAWLQHGEGRVSLAFCQGIAHAQGLAAMFRKYNVDACAIWDGDPERDQKIERLRRGEVQVITNCGILTEGFDCWRIGCILLARPTKSTLLYIQMVGRGTRIPDGVENLLTTPASVKRECILMDFVDNCGRHSIVTSNMLFDLPETLELRGESLLRTKKRLEIHPEIDYSGLRTIDQINTYLEEVELFDWTVPSELEHAILRWHRVNQAHFALSFDDREELANSVSFHVKETALGLWQGYLAGGQPMFDHGVEFNEAIRRVEAAVRAFNPQAYSLLNRKARWNNDPPTPKQLEHFEKEWRARTHKQLPTGLTKGQVSDFLSHVWKKHPGPGAKSVAVN